MIQFESRYIILNYLSKQNIYVMKINGWFVYYLHVEVEGRMLQWRGNEENNDNKRPDLALSHVK